MTNKDFFEALEELSNSRGIKQSVLIEALENAIGIAYKREHEGNAKAIEVRLNPDKNSIKIYAYQTVVEEVVDKEKEISLEDARAINKKYKVGDIVSEEVNTKDIARIAAQTAKQVITQKLRDIETELAFSELSSQEDEIISCVVKRIDGDNVRVEVNRQVEAVLTPKDLAPNDKLTVGSTVKVYVKKIKAGQRGPQILISRTDPGFVKKLFEMEVPEIANGTITVKAIVREAGYRTKMAIACDNKNIDPVGACVGYRGSRVNTIVSELGGEKIDIIPWDADILEFIARSLSPAKVVMVQANEETRSAKVIVMDDMLSLAIGKDGQNARLAARLTGWKIDVKPYSSVAGQDQDEANTEEVVEPVAEEANFEDVFDEDLGDLE